MIKRLSHKNYIVWRRGINPGSPELKNSSKHNRQMLFAISNNFKKTIRSITKWLICTYCKHESDMQSNSIDEIPSKDQIHVYLNEWRISGIIKN